MELLAGAHEAHRLCRKPAQNDVAALAKVANVEQDVRDAVELDASDLSKHSKIVKKDDRPVRDVLVARGEAQCETVGQAV